MNGDEESRPRDMKAASAGWVRVERGVRAVMQIWSREYAVRLDPGSIVRAWKFMLPSPKGRSLTRCHEAMRRSDGCRETYDARQRDHKVCEELRKNEGVSDDRFK